MAVIGDGRKISMLSPMDLESHRRWYGYSRARDDTRARTDTSLAPWYLVNAYDKKLVGLNCISHFLSLIPYREIKREGTSPSNAAKAARTSSPKPPLQQSSSSVLIRVR